jgi:hypothetical protein
MTKQEARAKWPTKPNLLARFEPLLGWPTVEQPLFDYAASKNVG